MICKCRSCKQFFWRYQRQHPPAGFCSVGCKEAAMERRAILPPREITAPEAIGLLKTHLVNAHGSAPVTAWFSDCEACGRIEARYAEALHGAVFEPEKTRAA